MLSNAVTTVAPDGAIDAPIIDTIVKYRTGTMTLLSFALILLAKGIYIYKLIKEKKGLGSIVGVLVGNIEGSNDKKAIAVKVSKDLAGKQESLVLHQIVKKTT